MNDAEPLPPLPDAKPRWRWWFHMILIGSYPLLVGLYSALSMDPASSGKREAILPKTISGLAVNTAVELILFSIFLGVAVMVSKPRLEDLYLKWKGAWRPIVFGFIYSFLLRFGVAILVFGVVLLIVAMGNKDMASLMKKLRPETEALVDFDTLKSNPLYLWMNLTVVSFILAGLREEIWRAGVFAGFKNLFPRFYATIPGKFFICAAVAVIFGLGHIPQGWGGVFLTGALGFGLGLIMVFHNSIWEAVLAHGFFNATSFLALYIMVKYYPKQLEAL